MTRKRTKRVSREVAEAWVDLYETVFVTIMQGILKATTVEEDYANLADEVREKTQEQIHRIARSAAEKFVQLANPDPAAASKEQIAAWKVQAMEHALRS